MEPQTRTSDTETKHVSQNHSQKQKNVGREDTRTVAVDIPSQDLKIIIMNASGSSDGPGSAERRKQVISEIISSRSPQIVLFQEFTWSGITGKTWRQAPIPDKYEYTGHQDASLMFDKNDIMMVLPSPSELQRVLDEMIRLGDLPSGFTPLPRMCVRFMKTKGIPEINFIVISWHGRYKKQKETTRVEELKNILKFITNYSKRKEMPVLFAGDFNLRIESAIPVVQKPLVLYGYNALDRRKDNLIDYFIASDNLKLSKINAINIEDTGALDPLKVLDHDPVEAHLSKAPVSKEKTQRQSLMQTPRRIVAQKMLLSTLSNNHTTRKK